MTSFKIISMLTFSLLLASCSTDDYVDCDATDKKVTKEECAKAKRKGVGGI